MRGLLGRFAGVGLMVTAFDVALLSALHGMAGWPLLRADVVAVAAAALFSYAAHRTLTLRGDPFVRWVYQPGAVATVALLGVVADLSVLMAVTPARPGYAALLAAKALAVAVASVIRLVAYRWVLFQRVRRTHTLRDGRSQPPGECRLTVVVPAFGEETRIGTTVQRLRDELSSVHADGGLEIVVVDDGSADDTAGAASRAGADVALRLPHNRGKGAAVRAGMLAAKGRTVAFTDADLAYSPDQLRSLLVEVEKGWDMVVGSRRHTGTTTLVRARRLREVGGRVINVLTTTLLLGQYRDTQCGLKAFRSDVARLLFGQTRIDGFAFDIELFHLAERYELSVLEVPVRVENSERSTVRVARDALRLGRDLVRVRRWAMQGTYAELPEGALGRHDGTPRPGDGRAGSGRRPVV